MNGRVYDPMLGRFLSPDPYVQLPGYADNFNRYSYCINNPLKYTDPSGEKWHWPKFRSGHWIPIIGQFNYIMEMINDNTVNLRQNMIDAGIPNFSIGVNVNPGSNSTFYAGVGNNSIMPAIAYSTSYGLGFGNAGNSGFSEFHYTSVNYNFSEQNVLSALNEGIGNYYQSLKSFDDFKRDYWKSRTSFELGPLIYSGWCWDVAANSVGDGRNFYVNPYADAITTIGSSAGIHGNNIYVYSRMIHKHYRPSSLKYGGITQKIGLAGDLISIGGTGLQFALNLNQNISLEQKVMYGIDFGMAVVGGVPVYGDAANFVYMGAKAWANNTQRRINESSDGGAQVIHELETMMMMNCFAEGSPVLMGDGTYKNIESIYIGDSVLTYNFDNERFEIKPVQQIDAPVCYKLIKIYFNNGEEIISTEDHPYFVKDKGWCSFAPAQTFKNYGIKVKQLEVSVFCLRFRNDKLKKVKIIQIESFEKSIKTYNLTKIANSNNYFVNGILVNSESKSE